MRSICIFGDSIVHGADDVINGGWVGRIQRQFDTIENWVSVYNLGIPGDTSADVLQRFSGEFAARDADVVIFAVGINDTQFIRSTGQQRVRLAEFTKNMTELLTVAKRATPHIIVVGLTPVDEARSIPSQWDPDKEFRNETIDAYNVALEKTTKQCTCSYVDVSKILDTTDLEDGVHPNASGHQKLFEIIVKNIQANTI